MDKPQRKLGEMQPFARWQEEIRIDVLIDGAGV